MRRIEELLNIAQNRQRYDYLRSALLNQRLAVFFGAGLSLGGEIARRWSGPFSEIRENILLPRLNYFEKYIQNLAQPPQNTDAEYAAAIDTGRNFAARIRALLGDAQTSYLEGRFYEAGDQLFDALDEIKKAYSRFAIEANLGDIQNKSFNDLIVDVFNADVYPEVEADFDSPYTIPALFFLPYIGNFLITTNIDPSFTRVYERLNNQQWNSIIPNENIRIGIALNQRTKRIFYIHGYILAPETLVMTGAKYNIIYPRDIPEDGAVSGARELLKRTVENNSILFLGASLQQDRTVEIINLEAGSNVNRQERDLHFVPVVGAVAGVMVATPPNIKYSEPILYKDKEYLEISFLLLQLIRDTNKNWKACSWMAPDFLNNAWDISDELKRELEIFLSPDDADFFKEKLIQNDVNPFHMVHYLYKYHSVSNHGCGLGWNICCITENDFTLDGCEGNEVFSPLHNYPIGDSIYILYSKPQNIYGEFSLYKERAIEIKETIKKWRKDHFPFYPEKKGKNIFNSFSPRIRIIIFPLEDSPRTKEAMQDLVKANKKLENKIGNLEEVYIYLFGVLSQNDYNLKPDQKQAMLSLSFEALMGLFEALKSALSLVDKVERFNKIDSVIKDYLPYNVKTLQRTLNTEGDNFEQNLQ